MGLGRGHFLRRGGKGGGNQQGWLAMGWSLPSCVLQALVHDALVRGVHVHNHHALGVLGQDVNAVRSAPRRGPGARWAGARGLAVRLTAAK